MTRDLIERYQRWYEYERDAHARVIHSLASVPEARRSTPEYARALSILGHVAAARRLWLGRLGVLPPIAGPLFPEQVTLDQITEQLRTVEQQWAEYLDSLTDTNLTQVFEYQSLDAGRFRNRIEEILTQLFGHSWYHRGQIAMLVKAAGGEPAITDFIYWCREPVSPG